MPRSSNEGMIGPQRVERTDDIAANNSETGPQMTTVLYCFLSIWTLFTLIGCVPEPALPLLKVNDVLCEHEVSQSVSTRAPTDLLLTLDTGDALTFGDLTVHFAPGTPPGCVINDFSQLVNAIQMTVAPPQADRQDCEIIIEPSNNAHFGECLLRYGAQ